MTRATDGDAGSELVSATFPIREGTANADTWWTVTNDTITIGTTVLTFSQTAGAGTYTNGSGLTLTGNSFSIASSAITNAMLAGSIDLTTKVTGILPSRMVAQRTDSLNSPAHLRRKRYTRYRTQPAQS
jgi:hypothetical protein